MKRAIYVGPTWENKNDGYVGFGLTGNVVRRNETQYYFIADNGKKFIFYTEELYFTED